MFSVIIPLFNKSPFISKAIQSVLDQTFQEFELIIVNDGSTDNSLEIAMQFTDSRIRIIEQPNAGVSTARNNGVKASKYDYIAFLDADDWWHPDFLKEVKQCIEEFPEAGIYGSNFYIVKNNENRSSTVGLPSNFSNGYINYCETYASTFCTPFNCSFVVVKKTVINEQNGFNPQLKFGEDFELWIRIALKHKVAYCNKPLAFSNQDVPVNQRALGGKKWNTHEHFIFNLDFLHEEEQENHKLKKLLDGLRVRSLQTFYLNNWHKDAVKKELKKIDFKNQPTFYRRIYTYPKWMVQLYFKMKHFAWKILKER